MSRDLKAKKDLPGKYGGQDFQNSGGQDTLSRSTEEKNMDVSKAQGADGHGGGWRAMEIWREDWDVGWDTITATEY